MEPTPFGVPVPSAAPSGDSNCRELLLLVTDWLEEQGILDVSNQGIRLTEEGRRALERAAASNQVLADFLDFKRDILSQVEATQAMLAIVHARFTENGAND